MAGPLNVYLDAQDFPNFSKKIVAPADELVFDFLDKKLRDGDIVIGYSYPLLFEIIKRAEPNFVTDRQRRAEIISSICRENSHPYYEDFSKGRRFPNDGIWAPIDTFDAINPVAIEKLIERILSGIADRLHLSRAARRKIHTKSGRKDVFAGIKLGPFKKSDFPDMPVPQEIFDERLFEKCLMGECSVAEVSHALRKWLYEPRSLYQLWYEYAGLSNPIDNLKSRMELDAVAKLKQMRTAYLKIEDLKRNWRSARRAYHDTVRKFRSHGIEVETIAPIKLDNLEISLTDVEAIFGIGRGDAAKIFLENVVRYGREAQDSDWGDLLHFVYLPDVDLFRCDDNMFNMMTRGGHPHAAKLVRSLSDLPDRIEQMLNLRA